MIIDHIPFDLEAEIANAMRACIERMQTDDAEHQERGTDLARQDRAVRERLEMTEAAYAASLSVYRRGQRYKALARGVRFFSLAFVLMMGVAAVAEMRMGGVL